MTSTTSKSSLAVSSSVSTSGTSIPPPQMDGFFYTAFPALASGAVQAVLFNPFDRALYVRVKNRRRKFLDWRNFEHPFQGFFNAAVYRTIVGASYMFWQDSARVLIHGTMPAFCQMDVNPQLHSTLVGLIAGSMNGFALNMLQSVKFRMWNSDEKGVYFMKTARHMYREAGIPIFFRGCIVTMVRDTVFGVVYETARHNQGWKTFFDRYVLQLEALVRRPPATTCGTEGTTNSVESTIDGDDNRQHGATACVIPRTCLIVGNGASVGVVGDDVSVVGPTLSGIHDGLLAGSLASDSVVGSASRSHKVAQVALRDNKCGTCAFVSNLLAAITASILSSPFNYVRSIVYSTPAGAIPLGIPTLLRSFRTQLLYIYCNGTSYTDKLGIPELFDAEHPSKSSPSSLSGSLNGSAHHGASVSPTRSNGIRDSQKVVEAQNAKAHSGGRINWLQRSCAQLRNRVHQRVGNRHHPVAAWKWANSRLNIGWGSLRVGFGMALGQSLFHMVQNYVRENAH